MVYICPPADYNGAVSLSVAVSQEASSGAQHYLPVALDFTLQPVSGRADG